MSENNNDYCGVVRTYYDYTKKYLREEYFINAGKKEGICKSYYDNLQLCSEVNYINNKMNGIYKSYYRNGQLWQEINYIDGLRNGIYKLYWPDGQLLAEDNYILGKKS